GGGQGPAARAAGRGPDPGLPPRRGGPGLGGTGGYPRGRRTAACVLRSRAGAAGGPAAQRPCALLAVCPCAGAPPGGTGLGAPGRPAPSGGPLGTGLGGGGQRDHSRRHLAGALPAVKNGKESKTMKLVILESYVMEPGDLDWSGLRALVPDVVEYVRTPYEQIAPRIGDAELVVLNKCRMDEAILSQCPNLRWVGIIATGTDNRDLEACRRHGVRVANVPAYSTHSVAQLAFSLLLTVCQCPERPDRALPDGYWPP